MNFHAWWQWVLQHSGSWMFLVFLSLISYVPIGLVAGYQILKLNTKDQRVFWIGLLFVGIGLMGVFDLIANIDPPFCECSVRSLRYPTWFAWWFWSGKLMLCIPVFVLWRLLQNPKSS